MPVYPVYSFLSSYYSLFVWKVPTHRSICRLRPSQWTSVRSLLPLRPIIHHLVRHRRRPKFVCWDRVLRILRFVNQDWSGYRFLPRRQVEPEQVANLPAEVEVKGNEIQNNTVEPASGKGSGVDAEAKGEAKESEPEITPMMQSAMRTTKKSNMKKGRKPGKGKSGKKNTSPGAGGRVTKRRSKRNILKKSKSREGLVEQASASTDEPTFVPDPAARKRAKGKAANTRSKAKSAEPRRKRKTSSTAASNKVDGASKPDNSEHPAQDRIKMGRSWMYRVLPGQVLGCANCRCIYNGCSNCRRSSFRGRNAEYYYSQQQALPAPEAHGSTPAEEPTKKGPSKRTKTAEKQTRAKRPRKNSKHAV